MTTLETAPAAHVVQDASSGSPNQYHLSGHGVHVSYYPGGAGPLTAEGPVILTYQDAHQTLVFRGEQAQVVEVPDLGTTVTVILHRTIDAGSVSATLLIPTVILPASGSTTVQVDLINTSHQFFVTGLGHPQRDHYTVIPLSGQAAHHALPL
jgi:hypothetical protein